MIVDELQSPSWFGGPHSGARVPVRRRTVRCARITASGDASHGGWRGTPPGMVAGEQRKCTVQQVTSI